MKKKIGLIGAFIIAFGAFYLIKPAAPVCELEDYRKYLNLSFIEENKAKSNDQIAFWNNKLESNPTNFVYQKKLANLYAQQFKLTGDISALLRSDSLLLHVNEQIPNQVGVLQSLATNAISRHAFRDAEAYIQQAFEIGENRFISSLILADVAMERGADWKAAKLMKDIASKQNFDFLIRKVKYLDQQGDLAGAIEAMEMALAKAKMSNNPNLINWSLSNLGDMYGHDGRIEQSYQSYLEALKYQPHDLHSLKGIAWIAYSHDRKPKEAKRIIQFLKHAHHSPEYELLLAELAEFEHNEKAMDQHYNAFKALAADERYGNMYNSYLCLLPEQQIGNGALAYAQKEVEERPHPMSFLLLSRALYQDGKKEKAIEIIEEKVIGKTFEPDALYHIGLMYKGLGEKEKARPFLDEALEASYELGPLASLDISNTLAKY